MILNNKYYIHVSIENLPHYFSSGFLGPASFYENRNIDIQSEFSTSILFSKVKWNKASNCSIECFLQEEVDKKELSKDFYLVSCFLPISRISAIYYCDKELMDNVVWSINETTAFIPNSILSFEQKSDEAEFDFNKSDVEDSLSLDLKKQIENYNRILGAFALSKILRHNYFDTGLTYSKTYISLYLSLLRYQAVDADSEDLFDFTGLFYSEIKSDWLEFKKLLLHDVNNDYVLNYSLQKDVPIKLKFNQIVLDGFRKDSILFQMSFLATYGEGRPKSIDDYIAEIESGSIIKEDVIVSTILLGLYTGYKKLRHIYPLQKINIPVKCELKNQLDYYTLELIYNYTTGNAKLDLDYVKKLSLPIHESNLIDGENVFGTYINFTNVITAAKYEFMSDNFKENLYLTIIKEEKNEIDNYISTIKKYLDIYDDSKLIAFSKLTKNLVDEIVNKTIKIFSQDFNEFKKSKVKKKSTKSGGSKGLKGKGKAESIEKVTIKRKKNTKAIGKDD